MSSVRFCVVGVLLLSALAFAVMVVPAQARPSINTSRARQYVKGMQQAQQQQAAMAEAQAKAAAQRQAAIKAHNLEKRQAAAAASRKAKERQAAAGKK